MRSNYSLARSAATCFALILLAACQSSLLTGPPELRLGRHECALCGMLVSEDRCSTAILVDDGGRRDYLFFDDIGCMLDAEHEGKVGSVLERYVHDYGTRTWVRAEEAIYVFASPKLLPTPMGSGLVAFAERAEAERLGEPRGAKILSHEEATLARRAYMNEHFAPKNP